MPKVAKKANRGRKPNLARQAKKAAKKERKAREPKEGVLCHCGCGEMTAPGRLFRQGHDGRFHGRSRKLAAGELTVANLRELGVQDYAIPYHKADAGN